MTALIGVIGAIVLIAFFFFYSPLAWGLVLYKFWYWFLLPVFPVLPAISYLAAVGLFIFIGLFDRNTGASYITDEYKDKSTMVWASLALPWGALFVGWIFSLFM